MAEISNHMHQLHAHAHLGFARVSACTHRTRELEIALDNSVWVSYSAISPGDKSHSSLGGHVHHHIPTHSREDAIDLPGRGTG